MGLFGPLSGVYAGLDPLGGLLARRGAGTIGSGDGGEQNPVDIDQLRKRVLVGVLQGGATPASVAPVPTAVAGAPGAGGGSLSAAGAAPAFPTLGGFTTLRTQLFGPLSHLLTAGALGS